MLPSRYFLDLTQPEIAGQLRKNPLVILPTGSVEQHGPHLPSGTDAFAARVIAQRQPIASDLRTVARRITANTRSSIGTPRISSGIASGARKK